MVPLPIRHELEQNGFAGDADLARAFRSVVDRLGAGILNSIDGVDDIIVKTDFSDSHSN